MVDSDTVRNAVECCRCHRWIVVECATPTDQHDPMGAHLATVACPACKVLNKAVLLGGNPVLSVFMDPRSRSREIDHASAGDYSAMVPPTVRPE